MRSFPTADRATGNRLFDRDAPRVEVKSFYSIMFSAATTTTDYFGTLRVMLAEEDFEVDGRHGNDLREAVALLEERSVELAQLSFDFEFPDALDVAHRSLYALYADRIWRAPTALRPPFVQAALNHSRATLEKGFRGYLARRRTAAALDRPEQGTELAAWFTALATGPHPHEDAAWSDFVREQVSLDELREIVANRSLFFLREPDPWIYAVPSIAGVEKAGLIDLLLDEYGWGKLDHMHSSVYARLMRALDLNSEIDHYEPSATWQYLATLNYQWMLALTPEFSRRLLGTIYLTEADSPGAMTNYLRAWERLGIDDPNVLEFYELHVTADENHRDVALHEVLMPVCEHDSRAAAEIAIGIFDGRTVEAEFAAGLAERFQESNARVDAPVSSAGITS